MTPDSVKDLFPDLCDLQMRAALDAARALMNDPALYYFVDDKNAHKPQVPKPAKADAQGTPAGKAVDDTGVYPPWN